MRFIEEENQLRLVRIADFGKLFEQLGQQPQQKRRIRPGRAREFVGGEKIDHTAPVEIRLQEVVDVERRLAEKLVAAFLGEGDQPALDSSNTGGRNVAIFRLQCLGLLANVLQHGLQVL